MHLVALSNWRLLYKTSDPNFIRQQDRISYIGTIASNPVSRRLAYDYMEEKWDEFIELLVSLFSICQ